jgi:EmrB/QacA subfamily drug resistance transporter
MNKRWTLVVAALAAFMTALDTLVVTTALPVLRVDLGASLSDLEWTVNAYNLAFACLLLTGAALGDRFGRRRMLVLGLLAFTGASAAAALSPDAGMLVVARAVQGAGAAIVTPLTLTLISDAFPAEKRGAAIGLWGGIVGLAVAAGPVVGGAVVGGIDWHWIFWLNVPVGLALIPLALAKVPESFGPRARLDPVGLVLAAAGALGLTWGLIRSGAAGWTSAEVLGSLTAGAALVGAFIGWERRAPAPMLPLSLFRRPGFAAANAVSFFMYAGLFGSLFLMAQFCRPPSGTRRSGRGCGCCRGQRRRWWWRRSPGRWPTATATGHSWSSGWCCRRSAMAGSPRSPARIWATPNWPSPSRSRASGRRSASRPSPTA